MISRQNFKLPPLVYLLLKFGIPILIDNGFFSSNYRMGTNCSCDSQNYTTIQSMEEECRQLIPINDDDDDIQKFGTICSNRGECECGKCHCYPGYTGKYCECLLCENCNNPEHGECICGECKCKNGWSGINCNCPNTNETCIAPNGEICLNHGKCKCGKCECNDLHYGQFCDFHIINGSKLCSYYDPCIECLILEKLKMNSNNNNNNGDEEHNNEEELKEICSKYCQNFNYTFIEGYFGKKFIKIGFQLKEINLIFLYFFLNYF